MGLAAAVIIFLAVTHYWHRKHQRAQALQGPQIPRELLIMRQWWAQEQAKQQHTDPAQA